VRDFGSLTDITFVTPCHSMTDWLGCEINSVLTCSGSTRMSSLDYWWSADDVCYLLR